MLQQLTLSSHDLNTRSKDLLYPQVVAAELNTEGSKDIVIYKIRVADSTGEWTVSRRFRNFESLQRTLKELPGYRIRMPAKRVFTHSQNVEFVEERRQQLDQYLQQILADSTLTGGIHFSLRLAPPSCPYFSLLAMEIGRLGGMMEGLITV